MALEIIGAGFGRTGTLSLKHALEHVGFTRCYHMTEVLANPEHLDVWSAAHRGDAVDWEALFDGYRAAVDWPSCNLWQAQMARFPNAKVVLSTRDPEAWYASVMQTIYPSSLAAAESDDPAQRRFGEWVHEVVWNGVFDGRMHDKAHVMDVYAAHNAHVKATVPPERLLVFEADHGWRALCDFLHVPVPPEPYPKTNTTEAFQKHGGPRPSQ